MRFPVRLTPRAGSDRIDGVSEGILLARVRAAPVDGAANEALIRLIAETLDVPRSAVSIVGGPSSRTKAVSVDDGSREKVQSLWPGLLR